MPFSPGDRVRLIKSAPLALDPGPSVGTVGTVKGLEIPGVQQRPAIWCVQFDDFVGQFNAWSRPGQWFVESQEIELVTTE